MRFRRSYRGACVHWRKPAPQKDVLGRPTEDTSDRVTALSGHTDLMEDVWAAATLCLPQGRPGNSPNAQQLGVNRLPAPPSLGDS